MMSARARKASEPGFPGPFGHGIVAAHRLGENPNDEIRLGEDLQHLLDAPL